MGDAPYLARIDALPREIVARAWTDPIIHAVVHAWASSDEEISIEAFLTKLVLLLSDAHEHANTELVSAIRIIPLPLDTRARPCYSSGC